MNCLFNLLILSWFAFRPTTRIYKRLNFFSRYKLTPFSKIAVFTCGNEIAFFISSTVDARVNVVHMKNYEGRLASAIMASEIITHKNRKSLAFR